MPELLGTLIMHSLLNNSLFDEVMSYLKLNKTEQLALKKVMANKMEPILQAGSLDPDLLLGVLHEELTKKARAKNNPQALKHLNETFIETLSKHADDPKTMH